MRLNVLTELSAADRARAVEELGRKATAPRNGQAQGIDARIHEFEIRYEMTSVQMCERFARGEMRDTSDVSRWLMLLRVRER